MHARFKAPASGRTMKHQKMETDRISSAPAASGASSPFPAAARARSRRRTWWGWHGSCTSTEVSRLVPYGLDKVRQVVPPDLWRLGGAPAGQRPRRRPQGPPWSGGRQAQGRRTAGGQSSLYHTASRRVVSHRVVSHRVAHRSTSHRVTS